jgi:hypothetical protein
MDEIVLRALAKWPNVPSVYNWLTLDRRGNWLVKGERIANAAVVDFIGRNYERDAEGRWYFQNGPQRVFVRPAYTPLVYRLEPDGSDWLHVRAHTGALTREVRGAWMDERGDILLETELGIGLIVDRDLPLTLERLQRASGEAADDAVLDLLASNSATGDPGLLLDLCGHRFPLRHIRSSEVATRFRFDPEPRPAPGEPEC